MEGTVTFAPSFHQIEVTTTLDQAGQPQVTILGLDATGRVWVKAGYANWKLVNNTCEGSEQWG